VGLPVSTAMSATVQAMKHLEIGSTVIATAYKETTNQAVKKYYEDGGVNVLAIKGLEVSKPVDQVKLPDYASYKVARELNRLHPVADSLLIQGRWRSVAYVQELEDDTKNPSYRARPHLSGGSCTFSESKFRSKISAIFCGASSAIRSFDPSRFNS
jgi:maleate cis-trans isomerase